MKYSFLWLGLGLLLTTACTKSQINRRACAFPATQQNFLDTCIVFAPNIFTPNGDSINDVFRAFMACEVSEFQLIVFDKATTSLIFQGDSIEAGWDGRYNGETLRGEYNYEINLRLGSDRATLTGVVAVVPYPTDEEQPFSIDNCSDCRFPDQADPSQGFVNPTREPLRLICD